MALSLTTPVRVTAAAKCAGKQATFSGPQLRHQKLMLPLHVHRVLVSTSDLIEVFQLLEGRLIGAQFFVICLRSTGAWVPKISADPLTALRGGVAGATVTAVVITGIVFGGASVAAARGTSANEPAETAAHMPADARSASSEAAGRAIAARYKHPVTIDSQTSPTLLVQALPDGTMQAESDIVPARVKRDGSWIPVDTSLHEKSSGWIEPKAAASPVRFTAGGTASMAQIQEPDGNWITESWPYGNLPKPDIHGASALYTDVLPDVDLQLTATAAGMSETLVVKSAAGAADPQLSNITFAVEGAAVAPQLKAQALTATSSSGSSVMAATPLWWDSSGVGANAKSAGSAEPRALPFTATSAAVSLNVDSATSTPGVTYPVYVDPDWSSNLQADWFDDRAFPDQSYLDPPSDSVGYGIQGGVGYLSRAFFQFQTDFLAGKHVSNARFNLHQTYANSCDTTLVQLWRYGPASPGSTWNQEPNLWSQIIDQQGDANGGPCAPDPAWVGWVATPAAQYAAAHSLGTLQLGLRVADEGNSLTRKHYDWNAQLIVTYNSPPNTPASPQFTIPRRGCGTQSVPVYINGTQPVTLSVNQTDPDVGTNVNVAFYVVNQATMSQQWTGGRGQAAQGPATVTIPASTLPDGSYAWHARAGDGIDLSASFSPWCYFVVDDDSPGLPSVDVASTSTLVGVPPQLNAKTVSVSTPVGAPMTVSLGSQPTDRAAGFVLWWVPTAATAINPTPPVSTAGYLAALPATGTGSGGVRYVAADANGAATVTVAPVDKRSTLWVASYDRAGNFSKDPSITGSVATGLEVQISSGADDQSTVTGHSWLPDTAGATSVADNGPGSLPLAVGAGTAWDSSGGGDPALSLPGLLTLGRYYGSVHSSAVNGDAPAGTHFEMTIGQMLPYVAANQSVNTIPVYQCHLSSGVMTSTSLNCEGQGATGVPVGYIWKSSAAAIAAVPGASARRIYRCHTAIDHFDTPSSTCEGTVLDGTLGFFAFVGPNYTTTAAVDTTKSFTVSAYLKPASSSNAIYTAVSQSGTGNVGFAGFALQEASGKWRFCMRPQPSGSPACVIGPAVDTSKYTMVTGIWDAVNDQLRIRTDEPYSLATAYYLPPSGNVTAGGSLMVGSEMTNTSASNQWSGAITDVTIYQGVLDHVQLDNLPNP